MKEEGEKEEREETGAEKGDTEKGRKIERPENCEEREIWMLLLRDLLPAPPLLSRGWVSFLSAPLTLQSPSSALSPGPAPAAGPAPQALWLPYTRFRFEILAPASVVIPA